MSAGRQFVYAGGRSARGRSQAGGDVEVYGGTVSGAVVSATGVLVVSSGGTASASVVSNGGGLYVSSGGTATGGSILSGGLEVVSAGGTASGTVVSGSRDGSGCRRAALRAGREAERGSAVRVCRRQCAGDDRPGGWRRRGLWRHGERRGCPSGGGLYVSSGGRRAANDTILSGGAGITFSRGELSAVRPPERRLPLEIRSGGSAGTSQINFTTGGTGGGTLQLDDSVNFHGVISGFGIPGAIDLRDIAFSSATTLGFVEAGGQPQRRADRQRRDPHGEDQSARPVTPPATSPSRPTAMVVR